MASNDNPETTTGNSPAQKGKSFIRKYWLVLLLAIIVIVIFVWYQIKMNTLSDKYESQKSDIISQCEKEADSLAVQNLELNAKVFALAVRSELLRGNLENIGQLIDLYVREANARLVQLVNVADNIVTVSSDSKFTGNTFRFPNNTLPTDVLVKEDSLGMMVLVPVMAIDKVEAVLVINK
jgi:hypothetical protein